MSNGNAGLKPPAERDMVLMREAQAAYAPRLLRIAGVHGVGIGYKRTGGETTDQLALVVRVDRKLSPDAVDPRELIPREYRFYSTNYAEEVTVVTDVQERARPVEYPHIADGDLENRVRPIPGGYSISLVGSGGGTLGGWVWDDLNDQVVLLTNNHVLGSTAGADVLQPSDGDGGLFPGDHFADVVRTGSLDATIAAPADADDVELAIEGICPAVYEITTATLGMQVEKSGRTTEHTTGQVVLVNYISNHYGSTSDFEVDPDSGISRFAYYGDSGSLIVERTHPDGNSWKRIVGLLWGGNPSEGNAYGHHIEDVFEDLDLTTVCAGVVEEVLDDLFASSYAEAGEAARPLKPIWPWERRLPPVPWPPRRPYRGIAREVEKRLAGSDRGRRAINLVHTHRVEVVELVRDRGILRALAGSVAPFVRGAWTVGEVFERRITDDDVKRFERLLKIVAERRPKMEEPLRFAAGVLEEARGRRLSEIFD